MIARLSGNVISVQLKEGMGEVILDVNGVGYQVYTSLLSLSHFESKGLDKVGMIIYTHVREDQLNLIGFRTHLEKRIFESMISVSGVGTKLALNIFSATEPWNFVSMIVAEDHAALKKLPGVGKKTAERMVIELHDKFEKNGIAFEVAKFQGDSTDGLSDGSPKRKRDLIQSPVKSGKGQDYIDALEALKGLGFKENQASEAMDDILKELSGKPMTPAGLIKESLKQLSR